MNSVWTFRMNCFTVLVATEVSEGFFFNRSFSGCIRCEEMRMSESRPHIIFNALKPEGRHDSLESCISEYNTILHVSFVVGFVFYSSAILQFFVDSPVIFLHAMSLYINCDRRVAKNTFPYCQWIPCDALRRSRACTKARPYHIVASLWHGY